MGAGVNTLAFMRGDTGNDIDISGIVVPVDIKADDREQIPYCQQNCGQGLR